MPRLTKQQALDWCKTHRIALAKCAIALALFIYSDPLSVVRSFLRMDRPLAALFGFCWVIALVVGLIPILREWSERRPQ